jgi:wyosine [tRNA(Phe)-imidazoG37] synthetase (radical SAM superfamily)
MVDDSGKAIRSDWDAVKDHSRDYHLFTYVYPVVSRRSGGLSIGVNLNPDKRCNFDCIYCEVDRVNPPRTTVLDLSQVRSELDGMVRYVREGGLAGEAKFAPLPSRVQREIKDIAFSGDGEPTMIPNFSDAVRVAVDVRREHALTSTKLVLITDAAGLDKRDVREGLELMDRNGGEVWAKLDAGTEAYYRLVNRTSVSFERIRSNLLMTARVRPIVIQSLMLKVHGERMSEAELSAYCDRLREITDGGGRIGEVHLYTVARPTPEVYATRLTREELDELAVVVRERTGLKVEVFE